MEDATRPRAWLAKSVLIFVALTTMLTACGGQGDVTFSNESAKDVTVSTENDEFTVSGYGATVILDSGCIQGDVTVEFASGRRVVVPGPICPEKQVLIQHGKAELQPAETDPSDP
ncbi:hypothetical protein [Spelaeicoccus albus]|uniref:Lipoprotein n=1 Tax=Spelaeicoccus albus TaxID=1280376 RepID=A0A7Z0D4L4_9MICO|nr:hypothetical protein [Spelaeicoccus albus]NYI68792.1 hypothetical protein [Spelaeicoccus albus]